MEAVGELFGLDTAPRCFGTRNILRQQALHSHSSARARQTPRISVELISSGNGRCSPMFAVCNRFVENYNNFRLNLSYKRKGGSLYGGLLNSTFSRRIELPSLNTLPCICSAPNERCAHRDGSHASNVKLPTACSTRHQKNTKSACGTQTDKTNTSDLGSHRQARPDRIVKAAKGMHKDNVFCAVPVPSQHHWINNNIAMTKASDRAGDFHHHPSLLPEACKEKCRDQRLPNRAFVRTNLPHRAKVFWRNNTVETRTKKDIVLSIEKSAPVTQPFGDVEQNQNLGVGFHQRRDASGKVHVLSIELL